MKSWKCNNNHPEVTNFSQKCQVSGCNKTAPFSSKKPNLWLVFLGILIISGVGLGSFLYLKPCPSSLEKKWFQCQPPSDTNIFTNPIVP